MPPPAEQQPGQPECSLRPPDSGRCRRTVRGSRSARSAWAARGTTDSCLDPKALQATVDAVAHQGRAIHVERPACSGRYRVAPRTNGVPSMPRCIVVGGSACAPYGGSLVQHSEWDASEGQPSTGGAGAAARSVGRLLPRRTLPVDPALAGIPVVAAAVEATQGRLGFPGVAPALGDRRVQAGPDESIADRASAGPMLAPRSGVIGHDGGRPASQLRRRDRSDMATV